MLKGLRAAYTRDRQQLPIVELDWAKGVRLEVTSDDAIYSQQLIAGAYMLSCSAPVWLTVDGEAGDRAGSIFVPAGLPFHTLLSRGGYVSALAVDDTASLFIVPVAN